LNERDASAGRRNSAENLNGVLNFLKPPGMTSFDAVAWARRAFNVKKAGHCGTLDPDAAGVLPICVGASTKLCGLLTGARKSYRVEAVAGLLTDTLDISGAVVDRRAETLPERRAFESILSDFTGRIEQIPPMYSAVKIGGEALYKMARRGEEAVRAPRAVEIYAAGIVFYGGDRVIFDVTCSKGAYVRSLCRDIGEKAGIYLCMSFLLRTGAAGLKIEDSKTVSDVAGRVNAGGASELLIPADALLPDYPRVDLPDGLYGAFMNGAPVALGHAQARAALQPGYEAFSQTNGTGLSASPDEAIYRVYYDGRFLGIGALAADCSGAASLRVKKFLIDRGG